MTSASELFHNRRSRFGRSSHLELVGGEEQEPPSSSLFYANSHRISHHNIRRHHRPSYPSNNNPHFATTSTASPRRDLNRVEFDGFDPALPRRSSRPHRPSLSDRDSSWLDQGSSSSATEEVNISQNGRTHRDRLRSAGSERLPGTVLLARERLLQRLNGVSLSANRQRNRVSSSIHHNDIMNEDNFRLGNGGNWEHDVSGEWFSEAIPFNDILSLEKTKRPPGLTQEALDNLQVEIFRKLDESGEEVLSRGLEECSICLESFVEGEKLMYLTCGHRFHCHCLDPWLRMCGDCPYCRKAVLVTSCR